MSPLSPAVLGGATLAASPALWASLVDGTLPLDVALTRYLIAVGVVWFLLSVVADLAFPAPGTARTATTTPPGGQAAGQAAGPSGSGAGADDNPETGPEAA